MSFIKLTSTNSTIPLLQLKKSGIRPSSFSNWPLTSTGIPELDKALGGGLPLSALLVLIEDSPSCLYKSVVDLFIVQGIAHRQTVALAATDENAEKMIRNLPKRRHLIRTGRKEESSSAESLRIAWRYAMSSSQAQNNTKNSVALDVFGEPFVQSFDLSQPEDSEELSKALISVFSEEDTDYLSLIKHLKTHVAASEDKGFVSRLVIRSFGSSLWENGRDERLAILFLLQLRSLIHSSKEGCVAMISVPPDTIRENKLISSILMHLSDVFLELDSCKGQGTSQLGLGDYHALAKIQKYPRIGGLYSYLPDCSTFLLKRKRRSLEWTVAHSSPEEENEQVGSFETGKRFDTKNSKVSSAPSVDF
eukprot:jgi/Galph1/525/GphlegSOOS_G5157.1